MDTIAVYQHLPISIGDVRHVRLVLVGCGGTGSFFAQHAARLAWHARDKGITFDMLFVDPDAVEERNVGRQLFVPAEVGHPKAQVLATRYSRAFGLRIGWHVDKFGHSHVARGLHPRDDRLYLVVGCVDNTDARAAIDESLSILARSDRRGSHIYWWLDCGNHDTNGQVCIGNRDDDEFEIVEPFGCIGLPFPGRQHPELVDRRIREKPRSCADDLVIDVQSLMVNQAVAGWAATYLYRLVVSRDLDSYATYFDLATGSARSLYIAKESNDNGRQ